MKYRAFMGVIVTALCMIKLEGSEVTPFNSWRALIVYTNSIDSAYGGPGVNLYKDYLAGLFDGINQTYENSGFTARAQIAGVIWDKAYSQNYSGAYYPGCGNQDDVEYGTNGMGRYVNLLDRFGADAIVLVHHNKPDGCAQSPGDADARGYASFWVKAPFGAYLWSHEMGHIFGLPHCSGHRVTLDQYGVEIGGALPDTMSFIVGSTGMVDWLVETNVANGYGGFHTTMAYSDGADECSSTFGHSYGGVPRVFTFHHQGSKWGVPGGNDWETEWAGTFGGDSILWTDTVTSQTYVTGPDSVFYLNRLKYLGSGTETHRDTSKFYRNPFQLHNSNTNLIQGFKDIPFDLVLKGDNSLGTNTVDSQWVYGHFAATHSVIIEPGFRVVSGSSMVISVGDTSGGLPKLAGETQNSFEGSISEVNPNKRELWYRVNYVPGANAIHFLLQVGQSSGAAIMLYDVKGVIVKNGTWHPSQVGRISGTLALDDLVSGVYYLRIHAGRREHRQQIVKW